MACRTNRAAVNYTQDNLCNTSSLEPYGCRANTLQYKPFTKTFYSEKLGWQTRVGSWNYPSWAVRYLPPVRHNLRRYNKC